MYEISPNLNILIANSSYKFIEKNRKSQKSFNCSMDYEAIWFQRVELANCLLHFKLAGKSMPNNK